VAIAIIIIIVCAFDPVAIPPIAVVIAVAILAVENIRERGLTSWGGGMLNNDDVRRWMGGVGWRGGPDSRLNIGKMWQEIWQRKRKIWQQEKLLPFL
jgi:hypothetical protein